MRTPALTLAVGLFAIAAAVPASAKDAAKKTTPLRYAHAYPDAVAEAKERGCVMLVSIHGDG